MLITRVHVRSPTKDKLSFGIGFFGKLILKCEKYFRTFFWLKLIFLRYILIFPAFGDEILAMEETLTEAVEISHSIRN